MPTPGQLKRSTGSAWETLHPETTWASVLDKPSTFTPTSHSHGNIANGGTISTNGAAGTGDYILVAQVGSGLIARSTNLTLNTGDTTTFLRRDGSFATPPYPVTLSNTATLTNKTLTSPVISASSPTEAGSIGYDSTNKFLMTGDGSVSKPIPTVFAERLTNDRTVSSTSFANTNLSVWLEAGYTYRITFLGKWYPVTAATNGIKFGIVFGGSGTVSGELWGCITTTTAATELRAPFHTISGTSGTGNSITLTGGTVDANGQACGASAIFVVATAGTLTVQTACEEISSNTLKAGATLIVEKILTTAV